MKRILEWLIVSLLLLSLVTACDSREKTPEMTDGDTTVTSPQDKKHLKLWFYYEGKERFDKITALTNGFAKTKEGEKIEVEPVYIPFVEFKKRLSIGLASASLPDIVIMDSPDHAAYAAMGLFAEVTGRIKGWPDESQYYEGPWKSVTYKGKVYGVPLGSNNLALFYNQTLLDQDRIKPPTTWDELKVAAKKLSHNGVTGMGISALSNEEGTFQFMPWLHSAGADFDKIDSPAGIKAFSFLTDLVKNESMSRDIINWTQADLMKQFAAGKVALMVNGPWQIPELKKISPNLNYGITLLPKDKVNTTVLGGENIGVVNGENVDASLAFVRYVTSPEVNHAFVKSFGYFPARKDIAADIYWSYDSKLKVFTENMRYAQPRGPHPRWPEISNAISKALAKALTENESPEDAAKGAQDAIAKILK